MEPLDDKRHEEIRLYLEKLLKNKVLKKKIRAIVVNPLYHGSPKRKIEVGNYYADIEPEAPRQKVVAIFESRPFVVCTEERGAGEGLPYFFTREEVRRVDEFD